MSNVARGRWVVGGVVALALVLLLLAVSSKGTFVPSGAIVESVNISDAQRRDRPAVILSGDAASEFVELITSSCSYIRSEGQRPAVSSVVSRIAQKVSGEIARRQRVGIGPPRWNVTVTFSDGTSAYLAMWQYETLIGVITDAAATDATASKSATPTAPPPKLNTRAISSCDCTGHVDTIDAFIESRFEN